MNWLNPDAKVLPPGYFVIDSHDKPHDGDAEDGRYGLYRGDPLDPQHALFQGNLDDLEAIINEAWKDFQAVNEEAASGFSEKIHVLSMQAHAVGMSIQDIVNELRMLADWVEQNGLPK